MSKDFHDYIGFIKINGFQANFPLCEGKMGLFKVALFDADNFIPKKKELIKEKKTYNKERKLEVNKCAQRKSHKIVTTSQIINIGFILERLAQNIIENYQTAELLLQHRILRNGGRDIPILYPRQTTRPRQRHPVVFVNMVIISA
jgi:hypothetical protein